jgi:hypothetical protein
MKQRSAGIIIWLLVITAALCYAGGINTGGSDQGLRIEFEAHEIDNSAVHGVDFIASKTYVDDTFFTLASATSVEGHLASTGTAVHGLGTISTQNADNVAITSGTATLTELTVTGNINGASAIASEAYVNGRITETDASYTLSLSFTTDSVATHAALMSTHGATTIASQAYVDGRITEADASYTLSLSFTADSVATHALLMGTHGATTIASAAHVDQSIATHALLMATHGCAEIASSAFVTQSIATAVAAIPGAASGNEYRLAAGTASESIYLNGTGKDIAVASGSVVYFEFVFQSVASATNVFYAGKVYGTAVASGATAYIVNAPAPEEYYKVNADAFGISAGISGGNLGVYASGTANSLWKIQSTKYWSLDDEP